MDQRQQLIEIFQNYPRHFTRFIKNDASLCAFIGYPADNKPIAELAYNAVNPADTSVCQYNNNKKFAGFNQGYRFCGTTVNCQCAKESVSTKVSTAKSKYTAETKTAIQEKRKQTTKNKYGVENVGQTTNARTKHSQTYNNPDRVATITQQVAQTKIKKYGNKHYNNSTKIKETWQQRNTDYWQDRFPDKDIQTLMSVEQLTELYNKFTPSEIAKQLNVHIQTVYRYLNQHQIRTPYQSSLELEMIRELANLGVTNIVTGSRKLISNNRQIDIFLPDFNLAIEMNGVYWHHDLMPNINKHYHREKFLLAEQNGIQLITIFSNLWEDLHIKQKLLDMIASKIGKDSRPCVYARKTLVTKVSSQVAQDFYNKNHIQGHTPATWHYGLTYKDEIVAIMSFSTPRTGIGKYRDNTAELVRYATSSRVVGGASKLINHFKKQHSIFKQIISYSNNEWSNGNMYKELGFELEADVAPSYFYFDPATKQCKHRYNYAKHKLVQQGFDPNKSETEIQRERGFLKIWDCGKRTWILKIK